MFKIYCEKCQHPLHIDVAETSKAYSQDMDYLLDETEEIIENTLQKYLIYSCPRCENVKKLTHSEWELLFRKQIARDVMEVRKREMFHKLDPRSVDPDNGLEYCGQCTGYADDGYCLIDIIKQCIIRK